MLVDHAHPAWKHQLSGNLSLNLWSTTNVVNASREALSVSKGVIVCISSICGIEVVPGAPITYSAAKAALNAYVKCISRPLGQDGIRINAIAPGNILFEGSTWQDKVNNNPSFVKEFLANNVSLSKFGTPSDIASLSLWLASPSASFCTGSIFVADGGQIHC